MMKMKKMLKDDMLKFEQQAHNEIEISRKEGGQELNAKTKALGQARLGLIDEYDENLSSLQKDLELRKKIEVHEIEERKNQHMNAMMKSHEAAFQEMKEYYNDITIENLELIRSLKTRLTETAEEIE